MKNERGKNTVQTHLLLHSCTCGIQRGLGPVQALLGNTSCFLSRCAVVRCMHRLEARRNTWCVVTLSINLTRWRLHVTAAVPAAPCRGVLPGPGGQRVISGKLPLHLFTRLEPVRLGRRATAWQEHAQRLWDFQKKKPPAVALRERATPYDARHGTSCTSRPDCPWLSTGHRPWWRHVSHAHTRPPLPWAPGR